LRTRHRAHADYYPPAILRADPATFRPERTPTNVFSWGLSYPDDDSEEAVTLRMFAFNNHQMCAKPAEPGVHTPRWQFCSVIEQRARARAAERVASSAGCELVLRVELRLVGHARGKGPIWRRVRVRAEVTCSSCTTACCARRWAGP
jgi:hypothetical protein